MNNITITGYVLDTPRYSGIDDETRCQFFVDCKEPYTNCVSRIPVMASGKMAIRCHAEINVNTFVEIAGTLYCKEKVMYVIPYSISCKQPKARTEMYISSEEFLRTYMPMPIIKRLKEIKKK